MPTKPFRPTAAQRRRVVTLAADGMGERDIAQILRLARGTVRKAFAAELATGRLRVRAETLEALRRAVKAGSAAAIRIQLHRLDLADAAERVQADPAPARQPKLGKKERAQLDAQDAGEGTGWGDLLKPPAAARVN